MKIPNFIQTALTGLKTSYALIDSDGLIVEHSPQFPIPGETDNLIGMALLDVWPELIGQEEDLERVQYGELPFFRLENVNRVNTAGEVHYLTLVTTTGQPGADVALTLLVIDVTEQGEYLQQLMQSRNELHLTRRKLAKLNDQLDSLLSHYLPQEVVFALLQGQLRPELGGEVRPVTILFADVRNFTSLAERLPPKQVVHLLNNYLDLIAKSTDEMDGTISQFQGDSVMIMFNALVDQPDHAWRAVQSGIAVQRAIADYQIHRPQAEPRLHFGVGLNTGPALVGNIGSYRRYTYTAIGDTVNLAARITSTVPADEVWISQTTYEEVRNALAVEPLSPLTFKGKSQPTPLYRVRL